MSAGDQSVGKIAFVGFGEAAGAFVSGWRDALTVSISAFDIKTDIAATKVPMQTRYRDYGVTGYDRIGDALKGADTIFCVVTADQALAAARQAAKFLPKGVYWFDLNSCAPTTKRAAAAEIESAGGRYVDVAVMAPVYPKRHQVPLLVAGPHASGAQTIFANLGMNATHAGGEVGQASAVKMIRSIMIKGMEALSTECFLAARRAGVDQQVLNSLEGSDPGLNWAHRGAYNFERMMVHGARRAAEMREVSLAIQELGLPDHMAAAASKWQDQIAALQLAPGEDDMVERADRILSRLRD